MATATQQRATLKTYHGQSMAAALVEVKRDLGDEAVILHTRTYKVGGVLGVGSRDMVEITASSDASVVRPRRIRPRAMTAATDVSDPGLGMPPPQTPQLTPSPVKTSGMPQNPGDSGFIPTPPWFKQDQAKKPEPPTLGRPVERSVPSQPAVDSVVVNPGTIPETPERDQAPRVEPQPRPVQIDLSESPASSTQWPSQPSSFERRPPEQQLLAEELLANPSTQPPIQAQPRPAPRLAVTRVTPLPTTPAAHTALEDELAAIRRLVGQVLQSSRRAEARVSPTNEGTQTQSPTISTGPVFDLYMRLLENKASTEVADDLTSAIRDDLTPGEMTDAAVVRDAMLRHLAKRIPVSPDSQPPTRTQADRPTVVALIGPTGVGKTATVAKLAATYKLRYGRKVGLVTADTYRIAAVEQLRTYADIVGLPLKIALSPQDMTAAIEALSDCDVVLVDTAGRSQHDAARLDELGEFLDAAQPDTTHLVLSLAAAESVIDAAAQRFGALKPRNLILSKLDEAEDFGVIANIAAKIGLPISYLTTGQEVPDHIEPANADRLARLVLDGRSAWMVSTRGV